MRRDRRGGAERSGWEKCLRHVTLLPLLKSAPRGPCCPSHQCSPLSRHVRRSAGGGRAGGRGLRVPLLRAPAGGRGAREPGLPAGQGAAHRECGVALRHNGPGLHSDERAAAAPRPPGPGGARLPVQPVRASGARGGWARDPGGEAAARFPRALVLAGPQVRAKVAQEGQRAW